MLHYLYIYSSFGDDARYCLSSALISGSNFFVLARVDVLAVIFVRVLGDWCVNMGTMS
jgi:hypothetical protein